MAEQYGFPTEEEAARVEELRALINQARHDYYVNDAPTLSDAAYDSLERELRDLEERFPLLATDDSPTRTVGGSASSSFASVEHAVRMYSLDNAMNLDELSAWLQRTREAAGRPLRYCCELKIDGSSIALTYHHGILTRAATRGDGTTGEDVTENIRQVADVPAELEPVCGAWALDDPIELRGEVFMPRSSFQQLNAQIAR